MDFEIHCIWPDAQLSTPLRTMLYIIQIVRCPKCP